MMHVLTIFGTRPEAIKMAPLVKSLESEPGYHSTVCVTAQHREMLDQVLNLFDVHPDIDLNLMRPNQDLCELTSRILSHVRKVLQEVKPDMLIVQGDTTTTFTAALAAFYAGIPIGHLEAGLRTWDLKAPFPEEANRCLTSRLASLHFCPTEKSAANLAQENVEGTKIFVTGNTVIDALFWVRDRVATLPLQDLSKDWKSACNAVKGDVPLILITGHRRENFGQGVRNFCSALKKLAFRHPSWHFVYPVHLNPNISNPVHELLKDHRNIHLIPPLDYAPFVYLMNRSRIILTDSGGVQEEAPSLGKPVLVMRETTERPEAVEAGTVKLVGTDTKQIIKSVELLMHDEALYQKMSRAINPYGDGRAADRIIKILSDHQQALAA